MNRYLATSLVATTMGSVLVFVAHGCAINVFGERNFERANEEAAEENTGSSSSTSGGGRGGAGGAASTSSSGGGGAGCVCADDMNECTDDSIGQKCPNGDPSACHTLVPTRQCTIGSDPGYCDPAGICKSCADCADAECTKRCAGQCAADNVCTSGNCVDGYCCNSDCTGDCEACNRVEGTCSRLPVGWDDCEMGVCGNLGACATLGGVALGNLCTTSADCASGICNAQVCVSTNGEPCVEHLECDSRLCDPMTHTCVACGVNAMCPDGASCLPSGRCSVLPGQPATNSNECNPPGVVADGLTCTLPKNAACTNDFECIYHSCIGSPKKCAAACMIDAECPAGTTCKNGACRLLPGSYCVINDQCQSATCAGFPRRCQ